MQSLPTMTFIFSVWLRVWGFGSEVSTLGSMGSCFFFKYSASLIRLFVLRLVEGVGFGDQGLGCEGGVQFRV